MRTHQIIGLALAIALISLAPRAVHAKSSTTIAVLYFDYSGNNEDLAFLRKGLNQMMVTDLLGTPGVTIVERTRLQEVLAELDLHKSKRIDKKSAVKVGKLLGARYLVMGGYFEFRGTLRVDIKVVDVETGAVLAGASDQRKVDDFLQIEQTLVAELKKIIQSKLPKRARSAANRAKKSKKARKRSKRKATKRPRKPKKLPAKLAGRYGKGLDAIDRGDKKAARKELKAVLKEQPDFELAQVDLASMAQ